MSYCINPHCSYPNEPKNANSVNCVHCGSTLLIHNRYRVIKFIYEGGFGKTYEIDDGTKKILKVLYNVSKKTVSLFQREANALKQMIHPGIPKVEPDAYFTFQTADNYKLHCLVMEFVEGENLQDWLRNRGNQGIIEELAFDWLKQLLKILDYLHQQYYFHRDIKPENIILRPNGQLVLIDFGGIRKVSNTFLAKIVEEREMTKLISKGYTAPEQEKGKSVPQSDFFALGRTFVHLLTGKNPNQLPKNSVDELIWHDEVPLISKPLVDLIDELMDANPRLRPENAQVILQRLADTELLGANVQPIIPPTELQRTSRWYTNKKTLFGFGTGITTVATAILLNLPKFIIPQGQPPPALANFSFAKALRGGSDKFDAVTSVAFNPDGQTLVRGSYDEAIEILNWRTGKVLKTLPKASSKVWSVAISPSGQLLATGPLVSEGKTGNQDTTIKLWNISTRKLVRALKGHQRDVRSVSFSPDGQTLASGSHDKTIKLWRPNTGELLHTFFGHTNHVTSIAFSPNGKMLASASDDKTIKLWNLESMKLVHTLTGHTGEILSITFTPDGQTLISGSGEDPVNRSVDNSIKLWNPKTGELRRTLTGHLSWVWCLAISPDGQTLASGSYDNSIRLWNMRTGKLLQTLTGHSNWVYSVAFSRNGEVLASAGPDSSVRIWRISTKNNSQQMRPK
ncbi:MAG: serine/threonine protein kinase [Scytonematopsis contorta HA4267-MV1]|jgi:WD40 repeat protein/predicted Ser/Thr protein kinase|nr:serine/threonine protein kinase [Scytonematopsis contorta HA4267-MV1]